MQRMELDNIKLRVNDPKEFQIAFGKAFSEIEKRGVDIKGDEYAIMDDKGDITIYIDLNDGSKIEVMKFDFSDWEYITPEEREKYLKFIEGQI